MCCCVKGCAVCLAYPGDAQQGLICRTIAAAAGAAAAQEQPCNCNTLEQQVGSGACIKALLLPSPLLLVSVLQVCSNMGELLSVECVFTTTLSSV